MHAECSYGIIPFSKQDGEWKVFVILHTRGDHWGFPKGHAEEGESPQEAAGRELEEETRLIVEEFLLSVPISEHYTFVRNGKKIHKTSSYFPARVSGSPALQQEEIQEGRWLTFEKAMKTLTFPEGRALFNQVLHELKSVFHKKT